MQLYKVLKSIVYAFYCLYSRIADKLIGCSEILKKSQGDILAYKASLFATLITLLGILISATGICLALWSSSRTARQQNTMNLIVSHSTDQKVIDGNKVIYDGYERKKNDNAYNYELEDNENYEYLTLPLNQAITNRLDYYEFFSIGLKFKALDEKILKEAFAEQMTFIISQHKGFINHWSHNGNEVWRFALSQERKWKNKGLDSFIDSKNKLAIRIKCILNAFISFTKKIMETLFGYKD